MVDLDPDLMAAQPESMYAAAAACETAAHIVNSVASATTRVSNQLIAEWKGRGAASFAARMGQLNSAGPDQAQAFAAAATTLRTLASQISEAQMLGRQAITLAEQAATIIDHPQGTNIAAIRAQAVVDDANPAQTLAARANAMSTQAWQAATAALDGITATSRTVKTATWTSAIKPEPANHPHDHKPKVSADQVKIVTQADGRRVYSFDGGLAIPVDLRGANQVVEDIKGYMPRFLAGHRGGLQLPAGLSAKDLWYKAAYDYITTSNRPIPRYLRDQFSTATSSSITFKQMAGYSMLGATNAFEPIPLKPELAKGSDALNNGDLLPEEVVEKQIAQANSQLERLGSALKDDSMHRSVSWVVDDPAAQRFTIIGGDGAPRSLYQIPGELNGKPGVFEWIVEDPAGQPAITHQRFIIGGKPTGFPNQRP